MMTPIHVVCDCYTKIFRGLNVFQGFLMQSVVMNDLFVWVMPSHSHRVTFGNIELHLPIGRTVKRRNRPCRFHALGKIRRDRRTPVVSLSGELPCDPNQSSARSVVDYNPLTPLEAKEMHPMVVVGANECPGKELYKHIAFYSKMEMSITKKCHNHKLQKNPWHREEEAKPHATKKTIKVKQPPS